MVTAAVPEKTLKELLVDWTDWDWAAYALGISLGLMPNESAFGAAKHVFWTDNAVGNTLHAMLETLVEQGIIERREEPDTQYRWNASFRGSWEKT